MRDLKFKINIPAKFKEGFNGVGKQRSGQNVLYGTYKNYVKKSGIYYLKNNITNLYYIGSSKDIGSRLIKHFSQLRVGNHPNHKLLEDFNKYGQSSFEFGVLEYVSDNLSEREKDYQIEYGIQNLYNLQIKDTYHSDSQRQSWKNSDKSSYKTKEYKNKMKTIKQNKIGQFDRYTHKLIKIFNNSDEVCSKIGLAKSTLLGCCNGSKKTGAGYIWHYLDKNNNVIAEGKGRNRTIMVQNEDIV